MFGLQNQSQHRSVYKFTAALPVLHKLVKIDMYTLFKLNLNNIDLFCLMSLTYIQQTFQSFEN